MEMSRWQNVARNAGDDNMTLPHSSGPLRSVRVVEYGDHILAPFAGRLLADLGAEVLKVETGPGDPSRRHGPFPGADDGDESGLFHALNAGKRGCRLDPDQAGDRAAFERLLSEADIFVTNKQHEPLARFGLEPEGLPERFPHLVVAIGSMFGRSTPDLHGREATALHVSAASGFSSLVGHPDRMPLPLPVELPDYLAGANLAAAALAAHLGGRRSGTGQAVEVAAGDVLFYFSVVLSTLVSLGAPRVYRAGRRMPGSGGAYPFRFFPTADGAVAVACRSKRDWSALVEMIGSPAWARRPGWDDPFLIARTGSEEADGYLEAFFRTQESEALFVTAQRLGLPLAPVRTVADALREPQFWQRRSFSDSIPVGDASIRVLRAPARFSRTAVAEQVEPAPTAAPTETPASFARPRRPEPGRRGAGPAAGGLLAGIRVLDLSWVWSGPMVAATLADLGAEVIKVEHAGRLDNARLRGRPIRDGVPMEGPVEELSIYFHQNNRGKKSVAIDLKQPAGRSQFRRLADTADVIVDNLSPGVFDKLGVGYATLAATNPRLIWLAMSAAGADGPLAGMRAYAPIMSAMAGAEALVGYPDDPMVGMITAGIGDPNASSHALVALLAALIEREDSDRGQFIDFSQIEAMVADMCEPLAELMIEGREREALGAGHRRHSPHGHYPCRGDDQWVAIAVVDDDGWRRLAAAIDQPQLAADPRFASAPARVTHRLDVDELVAAWTAARPVEEVVGTLAQSDITAVPVHDIDGARRVFGSLLSVHEHPVTGTEDLAGVPWHFQVTPARVRSNAPLVGQHTAEIFDALDHPVLAAPAPPGVMART